VASNFKIAQYDEKEEHFVVIEYSLRKAAKKADLYMASWISHKVE
jgi:hypothetical protein